MLYSTNVDASDKFVFIINYEIVILNGELGFAPIRIY